ncbi:hypothetical protein L1049_025940 [Liquidambar formosana]|uniref:F-box/kelch-repeat protein n=1 Tax=Liquidambar formosana TaxID=63359 RepID=A0AAP0R8R6_LIQFO
MSLLVALITAPVTTLGRCFEVFDPATNMWDVLPDPPFYAEGVTLLCGYFVVGPKFYVVTCFDMFCFDVHAKTWGNGFPFVDQFKDISAPFPVNLSGGVVVHDGTLIACVNNELVAYHFWPDEVPKAFRVLEEFKSLNDPPLDPSRDYLCDLGDGKI